jgi:capsule polysaccharide export protein KpsE/RkpR
MPTPEDKNKKTKETAEKKTEAAAPNRISLAKKLNDITFKNSQVQMVTDLQNENAKLKNMMGRRRGGGQDTPRIQGLQTIKNTLGRQFMKKGVDY